MSFFRRHIALILLLIIVALSFASFYKPKDETGPLGRVIVSISSPIQFGLANAVDGLTGVWKGYFDLMDAREEAETLEEQNLYLSRRIEEMAPLETENARLRRLLKFSQKHPYRYQPARVISTDILGQFRTVMISAGKNQGVKKHAPVVNANGVVGRVVEVFGEYARVLLMVDPNSSIDGRVKRTEAKGIIQGTNDNEKLLCQFAFSLRTEDIQKGDVILTSGLDQQFPAGLTLGKVVKISKSEYGIFQEAKIAPAVDFNRLHEVLVIVSHETHPAAP